MTLTESLRIALRALRANRLRSVLTIIGIMIGVAAVILLVALGNGARTAITGQIEGLGSNLINVIPGTLPRPGSPGVAAEPFTQRDVEAISDPSKAPNVAVVVPIASRAGVLRYGSESGVTPTSGTTPDYLRVFNAELSAGTFFTEADVRTSARVVVLGQDPVNELFGGDPNAALDQMIKIQRQSFKVIGVLTVTGGFGNADDVALIPINTAWNYLLGRRGEDITQLVIQATSPETVQAAEAEVTRILLDSRNITDPSDADFVIASQEDLLEQVGIVTTILTVFLGAIAAVSLIVGGIGVMNIMLVTVTERTREIGIRKAVGARYGAILQQFMIEAIVLSGLGGLLGVVAGVGLSTLAGAVAARRLGPNVDFSPEVSIPSVLLAFGLSVCIGLFFGVYPAQRAAKLRPIEALRYE
jgi:putative ABC transport system permease protein